MKELKDEYLVNVFLKLLWLAEEYSACRELTPLGFEAVEFKKWVDDNEIIFDDHFSVQNDEVKKKLNEKLALFIEYFNDNFQPQHFYLNSRYLSASPFSDFEDEEITYLYAFIKGRVVRATWRTSIPEEDIAEGVIYLGEGIFQRGKDQSLKRIF